MKWFSFFILAYLAMGIQIALDGYVDIRGAAPNFILLVVIFLSVNGSREPAVLGSFVLGLMQDLLTLHPMGTWAVTYALVALFVLSTQEVVYREHPLTHFSLTLLGGILCAVVLTFHGWVYPMLHGGGNYGSPVGLIKSAVYTALIAPVILGVLQRMKTAFGFRRKTSRSG